jgi:hypothetical protein
VPAVGTERQRIDRRYRIDRKRPVKMGEKRAAARRFPFQGGSQPLSRNAEQYQPSLAGAMLGSAFDDLGSRREMDEAVGRILGRAGIAAGELGCRPFLRPAHVMDDGVADHGRDTSGNRSGIKDRDSFVAGLRPFVAEAIFRRMREASCQAVGNLQIVAISESIRSFGASAFRRKPKRYSFR